MNIKTTSNEVYYIHVAHNSWGSCLLAIIRRHDYGNVKTSNCESWYTGRERKDLSIGLSVEWRKWSWKWAHCHTISYEQKILTWLGVRDSLRLSLKKKTIKVLQNENYRRDAPIALQTNSVWATQQERRTDPWNASALSFVKSKAAERKLGSVLRVGQDAETVSSGNGFVGICREIYSSKCFSHWIKPGKQRTFSQSLQLREVAALRAIVRENTILTRNLSFESRSLRVNVRSERLMPLTSRAMHMTIKCNRKYSSSSVQKVLQNLWDSLQKVIERIDWNNCNCCYRIFYFISLLIFFPSYFPT